LREREAPPVPATIEDGELLATAGVGLEIVNEIPVDNPPPGIGLDTVTMAVPGMAMSPARMAAVNCVELT
jgi:hypothetical protein